MMEDFITGASSNTRVCVYIHPAHCALHNWMAYCIYIERSGNVISSFLFLGIILSALTIHVILT